MLHNYKIDGVFEFFKTAPATAVGVMTFFDVKIATLVLIVTLIYTVLQIFVVSYRNIVMPLYAYYKSKKMKKEISKKEIKERMVDQDGK